MSEKDLWGDTMPLPTEAIKKAVAQLEGHKGKFVVFSTSDAKLIASKDTFEEALAVAEEAGKGDHSIIHV